MSHKPEKEDRKRFRTELPNMADDLLDPFQYRLYGHYKRWCGESGHCTESLSTTAERTKMSRDKIISVRQWLIENGWITTEDIARGTLKVKVVDRWIENSNRFQSVDISTELYESDYEPPVDISTPPVDISTPPVDISTPPVDISTPPVDISTLRRNYIEGTLLEGTSIEEEKSAPAPAAQSVSEFPVSKNTLGIKAVRITEPVAAQSVEIFDPPSKAEIRLQAAQRRIVEAPARATKLPKLDTPHVTQQINADGYLPAGSGKTAVEVYAERFSLTNPETRLTMPLQDDLVRDCPDLERLRAVLVAYSQTSYKPRNMKLILDWYKSGVPAHKQQGATANATISRPVTAQPGTGQGNLGKAARVGREEARKLFAHLPMYQVQEKNQ